MKKLEQIRENYDLITEKEEAESRKLTTLVRAGLFDPKKLPMLKRALSKDAKDMTPAERKILIELLDSLMAEVLQSQQVYSKVKQNVMMKEEEEILDEAKAFDGYYSKYDPRYTKMPTEREIPTIIILKRKAIRIYPDNQKVALYYSQALDKYVTIPFGAMQDGMNEAVEQDENNPYIVKTTYNRIKSKDKAKVLQARRKLETSKERLANKPADTELAKKRKNLVLRGRQDQLNKAVDKAGKSKETKELDLSKQDVTKLSKGNYDKLKTAMNKDPEMNIATRLGAKLGFGLRRAMTNPKAKDINQTFEESEIKSKFYNKRKEQLDELAPIAAPIVAGAIGLGTRLAPHLGRLFSRVPKKAPTPATPKTPSAPKPAEAPTTPKPAETPSAPKPAETPSAPKSEPKAQPKAEPKAQPKAEPKAETPASKESGLRKWTRRGGNAAEVVGGLAAGMVSALAGSTIERKQSEQKPFTLQAKTSKPVSGNVRTSVDARDAATYRKAMQNESVLNQLYHINENEEKAINIANESVVINNTVAKKIISVYESVNKQNKEKIEDMLNESVDSFKKIASFAARQ